VKSELFEDSSLMPARIYRPSKTAMQSGIAKTSRWLLEYEPESRARSSR